MEEALKELAATNVTKNVHRKAYSAVSPTRPGLSQAGRVVLITGGGTGIGFSIAQSFIRASAVTVILVGRRESVLNTAASRLEADAKAAGTNTKIMTRTCDVVKVEDIEALWNDLATQNIIVDVFVNNAAKFTEPQPLLELGADEVWSQMEANTKGPLYFTEKFCAQKTDNQRFIVNITSAVIHAFTHPAVAQRPAYILSKATGALFFQLLSLETPPEKVQIVTMHPGLVYNDSWKEMGLPAELFEDADLVGGFALWLASKEAAYLHGRLVWATWDVDELSGDDFRKRTSEDHYFLRVSVAGLKEGMLA